MKLTKNMLHELAFEIIEEHHGVKLRRPKVMLESKRHATHLSHAQRHLLKVALRNHMVQEGILDSLKNAFGGAKKAVKSFVQGFQKAPKNWKGIKDIVNQASLGFTNSNWSDTPAFELYEDKLGLNLHEWFSQYVRMGYMVKAILFDNKADLAKDFEKWMKAAYGLKNAANGDMGNGKILWKDILNLFRNLRRDKEANKLAKGMKKAKGLKGDELGRYAAFMENYFGHAKNLDKAERMLTSELTGNPNKKSVQRAVKDLIGALDAIENYSK